MCGPPGAKVQECEWNPFGDLKTCTTGSRSDGYPFDYAGYEFDSETSNYHMQFRYYNPRIGRFLSADPHAGASESPISLNRFLYTANNPINFTDPLGLDYFWIGNCLLYEEFAMVDGEQSGPSTIFLVGCLSGDGFSRRAPIPVGAPDGTIPLGDACPPVPTAPSQTSIFQNIRTIESTNTFPTGTNGILNMRDFYNQVKNNGPMDYKQIRNIDIGSEHPRAESSAFENFGNFNYGAVAAAQGYSKWFAQAAAGGAQVLSGKGLRNVKASDVYDALFDTYHRDDESDQAFISLGFDFQQAGCHE